MSGDEYDDLARVFEGLKKAEDELLEFENAVKTHDSPASVWYVVYRELLKESKQTVTTLRATLTGVL
jgi:hypothetical protein